MPVARFEKVVTWGIHILAIVSGCFIHHIWKGHSNDHTCNGAHWQCVQGIGVLRWCDMKILLGLLSLDMFFGTSISDPGQRFHWLKERWFLSFSRGIGYQISVATGRTWCSVLRAEREHVEAQSSAHVQGDLWAREAGAVLMSRQGIWAPVSKRYSQNQIFCIVEWLHAVWKSVLFFAHFTVYTWDF